MGLRLRDRRTPLPAMQTFLKGLTATYDAKFFLEKAERLGISSAKASSATR